LIQRLTQEAQVDIGNGFEPCTATAQAYEFPAEQPLLKFLDTRGLGETDYDPAIDLAQCAAVSHALLLVARADDVEQSPLVEALRSRQKLLASVPALVVHTVCNATHLTPPQQRPIRKTESP